MRPLLHWFMSLALLIAASIPVLAQPVARAVSPRPELFRPHLADYDAEPRRPDGRVDTDALVTRLKELGVTTYYWLIWHAATDWDDLKLFLPKAAAANIQVWPYLVPPTESAPREGNNYAEPFRLDYHRWAEEIARLSLAHTNLTAWVIDDFYANHELYTPNYLREMQGRSKTINPKLAFLPLMYFNEINPAFAEAYGPVIDGVVVAYLQDREEIDYTWAVLNDADLPAASVISFPWNSPSKAGDFVMASQSVKVQPASQYVLHFRERDDFTGPTSGYHFKQVLVDGAVAWESDVAGGSISWNSVSVDVTPQVRGKTNITLALRLFDKQGVSNFGVRWQVSGLSADNLQLTAVVSQPQKWQVARQGAFETGFGAPPKTGGRRFHIPFISMTAGDINEFRQRHGDPATPERIGDWLRTSLRAWREGKCDGVVTYCLDKSPASKTFPLARRLFAEFKGANAASRDRLRMSFDSDWKFRAGDITRAELADFNDRDWLKITLPHDWTVTGPVAETNSKYNGYYPKGLGWYRKSLTLDSSCADRQVYLEFEGIYRNSTLWVNGRKAGGHVSGYTGVVYDLTPYVHMDGLANTLAVCVDGRKSEGWWYEGCGIYRHVWLTTTDKLHLANGGAFITTPEVSQAAAKVQVRITLRNDYSTEQQCRLVTQVLDARGEPIASVKSAETILPNATHDVTHVTSIAHPHLWSPAAPYLYRARTDVLLGGQKVDSFETPFGVRWFEFTADEGFFLNGQHVQLRGMCLHHDFGGLGTALPDRANEKTVELMKQMGCNFLRSSHNDAAPSLMEACDRLGLLVWAETRYLGSSETAIAPLRDLIRRNRNHPSIICWSLANTAGSRDGSETQHLKVLNAIAHEEDATRPTAFACEGNADANANGFALVTDIMGYNGGGMGIDDRDHKLYPQRKMLVSEFSSGRGARGVYAEKKIARPSTETLGDGRTVAQTGQYFSVYNLCRSHEAEWTHIAQRPWLAGGAMWSGMDYVGETAGWPIVTSQFGVFDVARFPNDAYYFYLQEWTSTPMVHIFPHWTWPGQEGQTIAVWCYSNCESVELLLNGVSLGSKPCRPLSHLEWKIPYQPGALVARASKDGKVVCHQEIKTAGAPAGIKVSADRALIKADGCDLSFLTVNLLDKDGQSVSTANNKITFVVSGPGRLLGLCSGDPGSHENPQAGHMKAFNGLLLAIVQSAGTPGKITIRTTSPTLVEGALLLEAR